MTPAVVYVQATPADPLHRQIVAFCHGLGGATLGELSEHFPYPRATLAEEVSILAQRSYLTVDAAGRALCTCYWNPSRLTNGKLDASECHDGD